MTDFSQVQKRGDLYYKINTQDVFSGTIYSKYTDKIKLFEKEIKDGKLHGKTKIWYSSGQLKIETSFKENKPDGLITVYYNNGSIKVSGTYVDGIKEKEWKYSTKDGITILFSSYKNGNRDGVWNEWYENGNKKIEGNYVDNKMNGNWIYYYPNPNVKRYEGTFKDDIKVGLWTKYDENSKIMSEENFEDGYINGIVKYYSNGKLYKQFEYDKGILVIDSWDLYDLYKSDPQFCIDNLIGEPMIVKNLFYAFNTNFIPFSESKRLVASRFGCNYNGVQFARFGENDYYTMEFILEFGNDNFYDTEKSDQTRFNLDKGDYRNGYIFQYKVDMFGVLKEVDNHDPQGKHYTASKFKYNNYKELSGSRPYVVSRNGVSIIDRNTLYQDGGRTQFGIRFDFENSKFIDNIENESINKITSQ